MLAPFCKPGQLSSATITPAGSLARPHFKDGSLVDFSLVSLEYFWLLSQAVSDGDSVYQDHCCLRLTAILNAIVAVYGGIDPIAASDSGCDINTIS